MIDKYKQKNPLNQLLISPHVRWKQNHVLGLLTMSTRFYCLVGIDVSVDGWVCFCWSCYWWHRLRSPETKWRSVVYSVRLLSYIRLVLYETFCEQTETLIFPPLFLLVPFGPNTQKAAYPSGVTFFFNERIAVVKKRSRNFVRKAKCKNLFSRVFITAKIGYKPIKRKYME